MKLCRCEDHYAGFRHALYTDQLCNLKCAPHCDVSLWIGKCVSCVGWSQQAFARSPPPTPPIFYIGPCFITTCTSRIPLRPSTWPVGDSNILFPVISCCKELLATVGYSEDLLVTLGHRKDLFATVGQNKILFTIFGFNKYLLTTVGHNKDLFTTVGYSNDMFATVGYSI